MDPKTQYHEGVYSARIQEREARLSRAMHTQALASDIADNLHTVEDLLPHHVEPDLAKAVMETLAASAKQRMEAFKRLSDAIAEQPDSQDKEIALRHLELVGRTLPFDGFGGAQPADTTDEGADQEGYDIITMADGTILRGLHFERPDNAERLAQTQRIKNLEREVAHLRHMLHLQANIGFQAGASNGMGGCGNVTINPRRRG